MDKIIDNIQIKLQSIYNFFDYFLLVAIIALTGSEFFYRDNIIIYMVLFPVSFMLFYYKVKKIPYKFLFFLGLLFVILFAQSFIFNMSFFIPVTTTLRFFIYFMIASVIGLRFNKVYVNIIYFICSYSIVLFLLTLISADFYNFLLQISQNITSLNIDVESLSYIDSSNPSQSILFYVIPLRTVFRNNGPFWEPGMFAVFINIALAINLISNKTLFERKNIVFIIASITTLSTTSFLTTFIILLYHFIFKTNKRYSLFFLLIIPFVVIPIYNTDIIKGKFEYNTEIIDESASRFGAALIHINEIKKSPLIGLGVNSNKAQEESLGELNVSPNGLTNLIRYYGIPFSILLFILLYKAAIFLTTKNIFNSKGNGILLFIVFLFVTFSQDVSTRHFYYLIMMLPFSEIVFNENYESKGTILK